MNNYAPTRLAGLGPWPGITAIAIVGYTTAGVVLAVVLDGVFGDSFMAWVYTGVLIAVSIADIAIARAVVLPAQLLQPATVPNAVIVGHVFVMAVGIYGLVGGIMTGWWWHPLLFGAIALVGLMLIVQYLNERIESLRREQY